MTSLSGSESSVVYNPAGLYVGAGEWSLQLPSIVLAYNEVIKEAMSNEGDKTSEPQTEEEYADFLGKRVWLDLQLGVTGFYSPEEGVYYGVSGEQWMELVYPVIGGPMEVHIENVLQYAVESAKSFSFGDSGLKAGINFKIIYRKGFVADVAYDRLYADESSDFNEVLSQLEEENAPIQPSPQVVFDAGFIYEFGGAMNFAVGLSALDIGGADFKGTGTLKQLNTIGFSFMPKSGEIDITVALDFQDYTYSYFSHKNGLKRLALGAEFAVGKNPDHTHFVSFQAGIRALQPSWGLSLNIGLLEYGLAFWTEDFESGASSSTDRRQMMFLGLRW